MASLSISSLIANNTGNAYQNVTFLWWPIELKLSGQAPRGWLRLPGCRFLSFGLEPDYDERLAWQWGPLQITRPETEQEREDREEAEAEQAFMEYEMNRYTEWYY